VGNNRKHELKNKENSNLLITAGGAGLRVAARFSNSTVALIILGPLIFTGVFLGQ